MLNIELRIKEETAKKIEQGVNWQLWKSLKGQNPPNWKEVVLVTKGHRKSFQEKYIFMMFYCFGRDI